MDAMTQWQIAPNVVISVNIGVMLGLLAVIIFATVIAIVMHWIPILERVVAVYLILLAVVAGVHWILSPLIENSSGQYPAWVFINWFMAMATAMVAVENVRNKIISMKSGGWNADTPITGKQLQTNLLFYGSIVLVLWFYWNWFNAFFPQNEPEVVGLIHLEMWTLINPLFDLVVGVTGFACWQETRR